MARPILQPEFLRVLPPWLVRLRGGKLMRGLVAELDELVEKLRAGAKARFPGWDESDIDPESLSRIGRERRIRRGPGEDAVTYARRLRMWLDGHRGRGGPYALLRQLDVFFESSLDVRMDVVSALGQVHSIDEDSVITRFHSEWNGDGSGKWARFWVIFYLDDEPTLGPEEEEIFRAIPREWSAGHIDRAYVVLLWDFRRLWDYPKPIPTWDEWAATSTWGEPPAVLEITWS